MGNLTFRLTDNPDPEERLEEAALWKALHDEYGDKIVPASPDEDATFGCRRRHEAEAPLPYWHDPAFLELCRRDFSTVSLEYVEREIARIHANGKGAFVKSTKSKHWIARVPVGQNWRDAVGEMVYSFIDGPKLMVQELCKIEHEHRFFVIDRHTETYSLNNPTLTPLDYPRRQTSLERSEFYPLHRIALEMARRMATDHAVVDVAYINGTPGIVELNPLRLGQIGLFACDVRALAKASRKLVPGLQ